MVLGHYFTYFGGPGRAFLRGFGVDGDVGRYQGYKLMGP